MRLLVCALVASLPLTVLAQEANPTQEPAASSQSSQNNTPPIFKVEVVSRSVQSVSYRDRSGWTKVDFQGTTLAPKAKGTAQVKSELGHMTIKIDVKDLPSPQNFGAEFLTYVLWAISPDGHPQNLGEVVIDSDGNYKADTISTNQQAFGLIITAEPYFYVGVPSDVIVMQNIIRDDTKGKWGVVDAKFELLPRGQYTYHVPSGQLHPITLDANKKNPLQVYEAQNAIQIARYAKADELASDSFQQAVKLLDQAQDYEARKEWHPAIMTAREAVQKAEDSRIISLRRQQQMARDKERDDAAARVAASKAQAEQEAERAAQAAQNAQQQAEARAAADRARQEAEAARAQANSEAQRANAAAEEANRLRAQAVQEKNALRQQLLQQFNAVLQTRETPRGLVVNLSDVLFATGKYNLTQDAQLKLARLAGIIVSHPGLTLRVEGYTDSTGSDALNQKLSEQRGDTVREFLITQGIDPQTITSVGYGPQYPVASNATAAGRAMNRRVELVVAGEVIGMKIGVPPSSQAPGTSPDQGPPPPQQ